jgi:hypothetical protein
MAMRLAGSGLTKAPSLGSGPGPGTTKSNSKMARNDGSRATQP